MKKAFSTSKSLGFCKKCLVVPLIALTIFTVTFWVGRSPIHGKWYASGGDENFAWYINYTFGWGTYTIEGYPPLYEKGRYTIEENDDGSYTLTLYETYESGEVETWEWDVTLSEDGETLTSENGDAYSRV